MKILRRGIILYDGRTCRIEGWHIDPEKDDYTWQEIWAYLLEQLTTAPRDITHNIFVGRADLEFIKDALEP